MQGGQQVAGMTRERSGALRVRFGMQLGRPAGGKPELQLGLLQQVWVAKSLVGLVRFVSTIWV